MIDDKPQPQAVELEKELLCTLLQDDTGLNELCKVLIPECFYDAKNGAIFNAIRQNHQDKRPITPEAVVEQLKNTGKLTDSGGLQYFNEVRYLGVWAKDLAFNGLVIFQKYIRRESAKAALKAYQLSHDESKDEFELLDSMLQTASKIHQHLSGVGKKSIDEYAESYFKETIELINSGAGVRGLKTFIPSFDNRLGGLAKGRMITVAGRPGSGKTAFIIQLINNICLNKNMGQRPIVIYSLEMSGEELINRLVSGLINYPYEKIGRGDLPEGLHDNFTKAVRHIKKSNLHIVDNMNDGRAIISDMRLKKEQDKIELAIVDYIQLMKTSEVRNSANREEVVGHISRSLKAISKELSIPVLCLAQLNREVEKRATKKPMLSDLRESGSIEMDSDSVTFVHRPKYAGFEKDEHGNEISENLAYLITAKNRHGAVGEDEIFCDISCNIFKEAPQYFHQPKRFKN